MSYLDRQRPSHCSRMGLFLVVVACLAGASWQPTVEHEIAILTLWPVRGLAPELAVTAAWSRSKAKEDLKEKWTAAFRSVGALDGQCFTSEELDPYGVPWHAAFMSVGGETSMARFYSCGPNRLSEHGQGDDILVEHRAGKLTYDSKESTVVYWRGSLLSAVLTLVWFAAVGFACRRRAQLRAWSEAGVVAFIGGVPAVGLGYLAVVVTERTWIRQLLPEITLLNPSAAVACSVGLVCILFALWVRLRPMPEQSALRIGGARTGGPLPR